MFLIDVEKKHHTQISKLNYYNSNSHFTPMLSLENTFDVNGYIKFHNNIKNHFNHKDVQFFCELKFDGVALSLLYKKGNLIRALTRGDGFFGEDVTKNVTVIKNIPLILKGVAIPELLEVRGEVCMLKKDFQELNLSAKNSNYKIFSNARNVAAGSLRNKDILITKKRKLFFYCYGCNCISNVEKHDTHYEQLNMLHNLGFEISQYILLSSNITQILNFYYLMQQVRYNLSLNIDGIVVKVNSIKLQRKIGYTSKFPKWAMAIKFISKCAQTKLLHVDYQIGRTGILTPVAILEPVLLSGAIIQKASLYNKNELDKLNLFINDIVIIYRVGDVIPKIQSVLPHKRLNVSRKVIFPTYCPSCNSLLYSNKNNTIVQCLAGMNCMEQRKRYIEHFFSKDGLYAVGFSTKIIGRLVSFGYIKTPLDCFQLQVDELLKLKNFGAKSASKIIYALQECKKTTLNKFIYALGIPEIGIENATLIARHFGSLDKILNCTIHELKKIHNIGHICSSYFFDFIRSQNNVHKIVSLIKKSGITFRNEKKYIFKNQNNIFSGKRIVLTGLFKIFSKKEIINRILSLGGIVINHMSKNVDLLIVGDKPGKKIMYASRFNIKIILESDFINSLK